jgi:diguanylate cyclase (GGDEF)-like protein
MPDRREKPTLAPGPGQLVTGAWRLARPLGWLGLAIGLGAYLGFVLDLEFLWRPIADGRATAPWTSFSLVLLSLSLLITGRGRSRYLSPALAAVIASVAIARAIEMTTGIDFLPLTDPWQAILAREAAEGTPVRMGGNTVLMFACAAAGLLARRFRLYRATLVFATTALVPPLVSLTGYIYGTPALYGQMAVPTMVGGLVLCLGLLCRDANRGWLKTLLGPWQASRAARQQILLINAGIFLIGLLVARLGFTAIDNAASTVLSLLVVTLVISITSIGYHRTELAELRARWQLAHEAVHDGLTGIYNRRGFLRLAQTALAERPADAPPAALLMLDIDRFKAVNDTFGHAAGDIVIAAVAKAFRSRLRGTDLVGRVGGEEFAVFLPAIAPGGALRVAEDIRQAVAEMRFSNDIPGLGGITISIGFAVGRRAGETIDGLMIQADRALYRAKAGGRDRVEAAVT